jgi:uncharacterized protein YjiS (DUF1127 family)
MRMPEQTADLALRQPQVASRRRPVALGTALRSLLVALVNRRAAARLYELDDDQLQDIGLTRDRIRAIWRDTAFYEDPTRHLALSARRYAENNLKA